MARKKNSKLRIFLFLCVVFVVSFCATAAYKIYSEPVRKRNEEIVEKMKEARKHAKKATKKVSEAGDEVDEALKELKKLLEEN
jgi:F0F1-type ATP synthase membrane subunit b/b'